VSRKVLGRLWATAAFAVAACNGSDDAVRELPAEVAAVFNSPAGHDQKPALLTEAITVGTITVLNQTVLPEDDFFAPLVNNLHHTTTKSTIRDQLNFAEGSKIERWQLYDAERYIRMLDPVKQAQIIEKKNPETGKTDLTVVTRDRLSAYVRGGGSGTGGYTNFGMQVGETSLFGRLYNVGATYSRENFRDFVGLSAGKQRIAGTKWEVGLSTLDGFSDSRHNYTAKGISIAHPFIVDGQRHAFTASAVYSQGVLYEYLGSGIRSGFNTANGQPFGLIYRARTESFAANYLYGIGTKNRIEFGPGVQRFVNESYFISPQDQYVVGDTPELQVSQRSKEFYQVEQFSTHAVSLTVNTRNGDFVPMTNFRRYLFVEDQFEGFRTSTTVSHANPAFGLADHYTRPSLVASYQKNLIAKTLRVETAFARSAAFWYNRYDIARDDSWQADLRGFWFMSFGTLAVRQYISSGNNLSIAARNAIAGEFTRGFYYGSISPNAGSLTSFEYRSPALRLPYILLAGVAFFDYAGVGTSLQTLGYNPIVGLGLRSMLYEFDNNVFRLDFGFNLNDDGLSFLNAMQFGLSHAF